MSEKIKISRAIVVEGKYDKIKLSSLIDGKMIVTHGFQIYRDKQTRRLIRMYAERQGLIVLTDSDAAGRQIRGYIKSILPKELHSRVASVHIPQVEGKERRKSAPSAEGTLGVEGIDADTLRQLLAPYADNAESSPKGGISKSDLYELGLSGGHDSSEKRARLAKGLGLPSGLSANALLDLLNSLYEREEFITAACGILDNKG